MDISATIDLATQPLIEQIESQQKEIEQLKEEKEAVEFLLVGEKNANKMLNNWLVNEAAENTKLKEENKALQGVIDGMKIIIKNLEDERN